MRIKSSVGVNEIMETDVYPTLMTFRSSFAVESLREATSATLKSELVTARGVFVPSSLGEVRGWKNDFRFVAE